MCFLMPNKLYKRKFLITKIFTELIEHFVFQLVKHFTEKHSKTERCVFLCQTTHILRLSLKSSNSY